MVALGKNHLNQKRSVSMALFLTQNLFVASGINNLQAKESMKTPPEKLEAKSAEMLRVAPFQFLILLLPVRRGWGANQSLQPTPVGVVCSAFAGHVIGPAWLSLGR